MATLSGTDGNDVLTGTDVDDFIFGNLGADRLYGGVGNDMLQAGRWDPVARVYVDDAGDLLDGDAGNDRLYGASGDDTLRGGDGNDYLVGNDGSDTLDGGAGFDELLGAKGNDTYIIDDLGDRISEAPDGGEDTVIVSVSGAKIAAANIETITYVGGALPLAYWLDVLVAGFYWGPVGKPTTLTYGFLTDNADSTFRPFSAADEATAEQVLSLWSQAANLTFVEASNPDDAKIQFGFFDIQASGQAGYPSLTRSSVVKIDVSSKASLHLLLHETGHALGLSHPGNYSGTESGPFLSAAEDGWDNTQLSYKFSSTSRSGDPSYAVTMRPLDIAAVQYLYGVNPSINSGDTIYKYSQLAWPNMLIGDASGIDVIDASDVKPQPAGFVGSDMTIDLRPGMRIFAGAAKELITAPGQVSINYGTVIENAIGSAGRDLIVGNEVGNVLWGRGGNDSLDGGVGTDTAAYTRAASGYALTRSGAQLSITDKTGAEGTDKLVAVERLQFTDKTFDLVNPPREGVPAYGQQNGFLFDAVFYLLDNAELVPTQTLTTALQHYFTTGAAQGKQPNSWFDPTYYESRWPDLKAGDFSDDILFMHYNRYGVWEGRSAGPKFDKFDGNRYLADNPDVAAYVDAYVADFLGSRTNGAIAHYVIYGQHEQRLAYDLVGQPIDLGYTVDLGG